MTFSRFFLLCILTFPLIAKSQQYTEHLDSQLEASAKCIDKEAMIPSLAAYRLLLSSHVVVKSHAGPLTMYISPMDPRGGAKVWGLNPTRVVAVEKNGAKTALIGTLYSADYPLSDNALIGAFQGGLKRNVKLIGFSAPLWMAAGLSEASISSEPVYQNKHLFFGKIAQGERILLCATLQELEVFTK